MEMDFCIQHTVYIISLYLFINTKRDSSHKMSFYNKGINAMIYITLTCLSKPEQHGPNHFPHSVEVKASSIKQNPFYFCLF